MRFEVNKRIEQNMVEIIKILDDMQQGLLQDSTGRSSTHDDDEEEFLKVISSATILRASAAADEDID